MKGCIEPIFKKVNSYKRIYIDLLGMGKSNNCSLEYVSLDKILEMLLSFIKEKIDKKLLRASARCIQSADRARELVPSYN